MTFKAIENKINHDFHQTNLKNSISKTSYVLGQLANLSAQHEFNTL